MVEIPYTELSPDALQGVLEEFVSRDGCEYTSVTEKAAQAALEVKAGRLKIFFDPHTGSCQLVRV
jgi:uncharacterized protein